MRKTRQNQANQSDKKLRKKIKPQKGNVLVSASEERGAKALKRGG